MSSEGNDPVSQDELADNQHAQNRERDGMARVRAKNLESDVDDKAVALAVKVALRDQHVDTVLESHTVRLDQISGRVERIDTSLRGLDKKMDTFIAVGQAVAHKSISTRTFVMGVTAIIVSGAGYALTTLVHP